MWRLGRLWCIGLIVVLGAGTGTAQDTNKGLVGWWRFDEGKGDLAADSSPGHHDGEIDGATWVKGAFGTALWFGGKDSHVAVPGIAALDGSNELTLEAWVLWEGTGRYPNIVSALPWSPGGFLIFVRDKTCVFRMGRPGDKPWPRSEWQEVSAQLVPAIQLGRWYHLAATFKRPVITTYLDGRRAGRATWNHPVGQAGQIVIGRWSDATAHHGLIDEVKLYTRA